MHGRPPVAGSGECPEEQIDPLDRDYSPDEGEQHPVLRDAELLAQSPVAGLETLERAQVEPERYDPELLRWRHANPDEVVHRLAAHPDQAIRALREGALEIAVDAGL